MKRRLQATSVLSFAPCSGSRPEVKPTRAAAHRDHALASRPTPPWFLLIIASYGLFVGTAIAMTRPALATSVAEGRNLFIGDGFFSANMRHGAPMTCASCHLNGGKTRGLLPDHKRIPSLRNAIAIFPRYSKRLHRVVTLQTQIRICVNSGLGGMPPAYGGQQMTSMISYLGSLGRGQPVAIGGAKR